MLVLDYINHVMIGEICSIPYFRQVLDTQEIVHGFPKTLEFFFFLPKFYIIFSFSFILPLTPSLALLITKLHS